MKSPGRILPARMLLAVAALAAVSLGVLEAHAQGSTQTFTVNQTLGDGKSGRVWEQWRQNVPEGRIAEVTAEVRRVRGGSDTFLNLRFGDGAALESGRKISLTSDTYQLVSWNVGQAPGGQPLVLNAYNGEVELRKVLVKYQGAGLGASRGKADRPPRDDYRYRNREEDRRDDKRDRLEGRRRGVRDDSVTARNCRRGGFRAPQIEVDKFKPSGGLFSGKYRLTGTIFAACVEEAGYYEGGRLREPIEFPYSDRFERRSFNFRVQTGERGQIRVYTSDGGEDVIDIDELARRNQNQNQGGGGGGLLDGLLN